MMLMEIFEDREIGAILRLVLNEGSIPTFLQDGDDGTQEGIASLADRGFLVGDSRGSLTLRQDLAAFLEVLVYPDTLIDLLTMEGFERIRKMSILMKGTDAYSLAILPSKFAVTELPDHQTVFDLVRNYLGTPNGDLMGPLILRGRELVTLMLILGMEKIYSSDFPGLGIFSLKDVKERVKKGLHIPLIAGLLMFGAGESIGTYYDGKGEIEESLERLIDKGALERVKKGYRISKEFLPFALAMGTPDRVTIISVVKDPESDEPDVDAITFFEFGATMVMMSIVNPEDVEVDLLTIPDSETLEYLLIDFLFLKENLAEGKKMVASILREFLDRGEISAEQYSGLLSYFHAEEYVGIQARSGVIDEAQIVCPNCGSLNDPSAKFCTNCGARLRA